MRFNPEDIKLYDYIYDLPAERIAKYPLPERDRSRLLVYKNGKISNSIFKDVPLFLSEGNTLVFNDTKVIHARLHFRKTTGALIEVFCLEPIYPPGYEQSFQSEKSCIWKCLIGNRKKWKKGVLKQQLSINNSKIVLKAEKVSGTENPEYIRFSWEPQNIAFSEIIEKAGIIPIPPYLNRESETGDDIWYQTVYAKNNGSVAAPTAGFHFTNTVLKELQNKKLNSIKLTLHVGAGTFVPVQGSYIKDHKMHTEHFFIKKEQLKELYKGLNQIIAIGTTSARTLESLYWLGVKISEQENLLPNDLFIDQWEPYSLNKNIAPADSIKNLLRFMEKNNLERIEGITRIIIVPGYQFRMIRGLVTNFHQPRSTLLLLIAAFIGNDWRKVYEYALNHNFRFLSYGDSSLLIP